MRIPYTCLGRAPSEVREAFPHLEFVSIPLLNFSIRYKEIKVPIKALVDSGADISIFPMEIAEALELNLSKAKSYSLVSISGQATNVKLHPVEILYDKHVLNSTVGFSTAAAGARALGATGLLGQRGFFEHFKVSFNYSEQYFEVSRPDIFSSIAIKLAPQK